MELVLGDMLGKGAHLLDANTWLGGEFDPDGADFGDRVGVGGGGFGRVFGEHGVGGFEGDGHFLAAGGEQKVFHVSFEYHCRPVSRPFLHNPMWEDRLTPQTRWHQRSGP